MLGGRRPSSVTLFHDEIGMVGLGHRRRSYTAATAGAAGVTATAANIHCINSLYGDIALVDSDGDCPPRRTVTAETVWSLPSDGGPRLHANETYALTDAVGRGKTTENPTYGAAPPRLTTRWSPSPTDSAGYVMPSDGNRLHSNATYGARATDDPAYATPVELGQDVLYAVPVARPSSDRPSLDAEPAEHEYAAISGMLSDVAASEGSERRVTPVWATGMPATPLFMVADGAASPAMVQFSPDDQGWVDTGNGDLYVDVEGWDASAGALGPETRARKFSVSFAPEAGSDYLRIVSDPAHATSPGAGAAPATPSQFWKVPAHRRRRASELRRPFAPATFGPEAGACAGGRALRVQSIRRRNPLFAEAAPAPPASPGAAGVPSPQWRAWDEPDGMLCAAAAAAAGGGHDDDGYLLPSARTCPAAEGPYMQVDPMRGTPGESGYMEVDLDGALHEIGVEYDNLDYE